MRSLTTKLVLAFLLTSVAGVVLASIIIRQLVTRQFDDYVLQQQRDTFIADVMSYYQANGTLEGIGRFPRQFTANATKNTADNPPPSPGFPRAQFGLIDASGVVILPFDRRDPGDQASPEEIGRGMSIRVDGAVIATLITGGPAAFRNFAEEQYLASTDLALLIATAVMIGVALVLGVFLARLITWPVRELTAAAGHIAAGDLQQCVVVRSHDELGMLADQFNRMSASLARATQLRRQMTADIAHDLRTPLTVISGTMEALRDQVLKPTPARFSMMYDEIQLLRHLVEDLHTLSLADAGELHLDREPVSPQALLGRVADAYQLPAEQQGVALHLRVDERVPELNVDLELMIRALGNLVSNALRHTLAGGQVTLIARSAPAQTQLIVADTGAGIPPEHLSDIFERSYRADAARQQETGGSGLGLAIVKSIVEAHGGQIKVESTIGQGSAFTIELPAR